MLTGFDVLDQLRDPRIAFGEQHAQSGYLIHRVCRLADSQRLHVAANDCDAQCVDSTCNLFALLVSSRAITRAHYAMRLAGTGAKRRVLFRSMPSR